MIAALRFAGDMHPGLVIAFALIVALLVAWYYLRETNGIDSPYSYLLPGIRGSVVAMTLLILAGPVWHRRQTVGTLGRVVFALDQSASMSRTDSLTDHSNPTRLARASHLLLGTESTEGWLAHLRSTHVVDVVAFSGGAPMNVWSNQTESEIPLSFDLTADGPSTDLGSAIRLSGPERGDRRPTAIVLMTEGRSNAGPPPSEVAGNLSSQGTTIHTIGLGSIDEPDDLGIVRVDHPASTASDAPLVGSLLIRQSGFDGAAAVATIKHRETVVWQQSITMQAAEQSIPFEMDVEPIVDRISASAPRGVQRRIAVVELAASVELTNAGSGENRLENNARSFRVAVSTMEHRLLILDGSSRWEMRYLRNLFSRSPDWKVDTLLVGPGTDSSGFVRGDQPGQLPDSAESIGRYDAIILGEVPPALWTQSDTALLNEFVARGGGLIVIDGRYGHVQSLVEESLADLVPVSYLDSEPILIQSIRPTRLATNHGAFEIWDDRSARMEFWERIPAPPVAPHIQAPASSEVLAEAIGHDGLSVPWLVTRMFGAGRVCYLSTDQTWRWRYKVADRFHSHFWNQLLISVMQPPYSAGDNFLALGTDKIEYREGESATIRARLRSATGQPIGDSTVEALLVANHQVVARVPLEPDDPARGTYRGASGPLDLGHYAIRIRASGISPDALQASTPIWVENQDLGELSQVSLDADALQQIAARGGGSYFHESDAEEILDELQPLSKGQIVESDLLIWQSFYWFITIMVLLTIEWLLRKRVGLI